MSSSNSIGEKLKTKLHIHSIKRKPMREKVSAMRVEVLRMPQDLKATLDNGTPVTAAAVLVDLNKAKEAIWNRAVTDPERRVSVNTATTITDEVEPKLVKLRAANGGRPPPVTLTTPVADQKTIANGKALLIKLDKVKNAITQKQPVIASIWQAQGFGYNALVSEEAAIRLRINETIVTDALVSQFEAEIQGLQTKLTAATDKAGEWAQAKPGVKTKIDGFVLALAPLTELFKTAKADPKKVSTEFDTLDSLQFLFGNPSANVAQINVLVLKMEGLVSGLQGKDMAAYSQELIGNKAEKDKIAAERKIFTDAAGQKMEALKKLTRAMGSNADALETQYLDTLKTLGVPGQDGIVPDATKVAQAFVLKIERATSIETNKLRNFRSEIVTLRNQVVQQVQTVRSTLGTVPVLAVDWKQIDGMLSTLDQQMDGTTTTTVESLTALTSAKALAEQIKARLEAMSETTAKTGLTGFQVRLDKMTNDLTNNSIAGEKSNLGTYFPDERKKFDSELKQFRKDMATMPGAKALATFNTLDKLYQAKLLQATEIAGIVTSANTVLETKKKAYGKLRGSVVSRNFEEPNTVSMAIEALATALKERPASKETITLARQNLEREMSSTTTAQSIKQGVAQAKLDKARDDLKAEQTKEALKVRRREAAAAFADAKVAVKEADGDKLALDAIENLLDEADTAIKAGDEASATRALDRVMQRADLLLAHPEGEVNRQRKALPKLFKEWQSVLTTTAGLLQTTIDAIGTYEPDPNSPDAGKALASAKRLAAQIAEYKTRFTETPLKTIEPVLGRLASDGVPEAGQRKAREEALALIADQSGALQKHPLTKMLVECPLPGASAIPGRLYTGLGRLQYTVLTSVR
jgi:hypothetical protein